MTREVLSVALSARRRLDVSFEGGDFVGYRDAQFPIDPVHQQIGLRKLDRNLPRDRLEGRLLRRVGEGHRAHRLSARKRKLHDMFASIDRAHRPAVDAGREQLTAFRQIDSPAECALVPDFVFYFSQGRAIRNDPHLCRRGLDDRLGCIDQRQPLGGQRCFADKDEVVLSLG